MNRQEDGDWGSEGASLLKTPVSPSSYDSIDDTIVTQPRITSTSKRSPRRIMALVLVLVGIFTLADAIGDAAKVRIYESIICYGYWEQHDPSMLLLGREAVGAGAIGGVDEHWCKVDEIQATVAQLNGWQKTFDGFPGRRLSTRTLCVSG